RFLAAEGGLDAPERQALWPELAALNARLDSADDAAVCWMNALWQGDDWPAARALNWFHAEARAVPLRREAGWPKGRTWAGAALGRGEGTDQLPRQGPAEDRRLRRSALRLRPGPARRDRRLQPPARPGQGRPRRRRPGARVLAGGVRLPHPPGARGQAAPRA